MPATNCRAIASPPGMFVSDSTHMPPTGTNCPAATFSLIRANSSGCHPPSTCTAAPTSMRSGTSGSASISATALANVRAHLRIVSRMGQSQAESMWACPTATIRWLLADAGWASTGASASRPTAAVPRRRRDRRRRPSARARRRCGAAAASRSAARPSALLGSRRPAAAPTPCRPCERDGALSRLYSGPSPAVALSPSGVAARSTRPRRRGSPHLRCTAPRRRRRPRHGDVAAAGETALRLRPVRTVRQPLDLETGTVGA